MRSTLPLQTRYKALCTAALLPFAAACSDSTSPDVVPVADVLLLGAAPEGTFSPEGGAFRVGVAPRDGNGNVILDNVRSEHFAVRNVTATLASNVSAAGAGAAAAFSLSNDGTSTCSATTNRPQAGGGIDLALTFDASGSMFSQDPNRLSIAAGKEIVARLRPASDRAAVLTFSSSVTVRQELTSDLEALAAAIDGIAFGGNTALYQAVLASVDLLDEGGRANTAVVLLADGGNNVSGTLQQAVDRATSAGVPIFAVGLGSSTGLINLEDIATGTGGFYRHVSDAAGLSEIYNSIGFGVQNGHVAIRCQLDLDPPLEAPGRYTFSGEVVTTMAGSSVITPFQFNARVEQ